MVFLIIFLLVPTFLLIYNNYKFHLEHKKLATLYQTAKRINSTVKLNQLLKEIMQITTEVLEGEASSVMLIDDETNELVFEVALGEKGDAVKEIRLKMGEGIAGWVAQHGKSVHLDDVNNDPRFKREISKKIEYPNKAMLCVPIFYGDKIIGVLQVINKKGKNKKFTHRDLEMLESMSSQMAVAIQNAKLYSQLEKVYISTVRSLGAAIDAKDHYTRGHSERVSSVSVALGKAMNLNADQLIALETSALLHDIGKIGIKESILLKPGALDSDERTEMEKHALIGGQIIEPVGLDKEIVYGVKHHHEKYDGKGYPEGLQGKTIPFFARIIALADAFDAMVSDRPYRKGLPLEIVRQELNKNKGTQFDPEVVAAFNRIENSAEEILAWKR